MVCNCTLVIACVLLPKETVKMAKIMYIVFCVSHLSAKI